MTTRPVAGNITTAEQYRSDPRLVGSRLKGNDPVNLTVEARVSGYDLPEKLESATHTAAAFVTVYIPQARAAVLVATEDLKTAQNEDADGAAVRKAVRDGADLITAVKMPQDKVARAEAKLSEAQRLAKAVTRESLKARQDFHANYGPAKQSARGKWLTPSCG